MPSSSARSGCSNAGVSSVGASGSAGGAARDPRGCSAEERPGRTTGGGTGSSSRGTSTGGADSISDSTEVAVASRASSGSVRATDEPAASAVSAASAVPAADERVRLRRPLPRGRVSVSNEERKGSSPS